MLRGEAMMLAADRVDANLDFRQAITIYIYRPTAAVDTGGSRTF
jgi:hypothetical protein